MKFPVFAVLVLALLAGLIAAVAAVGVATAQDDSQRPYVDLFVELIPISSTVSDPTMEVQVANIGTATAYDVELKLLALGNTGEKRDLELDISRVDGSSWDEATGTLKWGRTVNLTGGLVWSTGFENWIQCTAVVVTCLPGNEDRPGVIVRHITSRLDLRTVTDGSETPPDVDRWGTPDTQYPDWERGYLKVDMSGPGKMAPLDSSSSGPASLWGSSDATYENNIWITSSNKHLGFFDAFYIEFSTLGTYQLTATIRTPYDDDVTDSTPGVEHSDTETYTFHVGPLPDLSVAGGASPHVARNQSALTIVAANNGPRHTADAEVKIALPSGALVEDYVASDGTYASGVWKLPGLKSRDYRRSSGKSEAATLTLILKDGGGIPKEPATATISLTDHSYTVCIDSDRNTLAHTNRADCKSDAAATNVWHAAVCVDPSTIQINSTHTTETACTGASLEWHTNICTTDAGKFRAGRTETECDGWFQGTVYDPPGNNTAKITAVKGTGGGGGPAAARFAATPLLTWEAVPHVNQWPVHR